MAFFDELSKKINGVTATAAQKTKEMSEVSRLNAAMNDEETRKNNAYYQIGRLYCEKHSEDFEEGFEAFINAVKESENRINDIKAQIRVVKGISSCKNCGEDIQRGVAFCSSCGTPVLPVEVEVKVEVEPETITCQNCNATAAKGMHFCTNCGCPFGDAQAETPQFDPVSDIVAEPPVYDAPQVDPFSSMDIDIADATKFVMEQEKMIVDDSNQNTYTPVEEVPQSEEMRCTNCGMLLSEGMIFCTECGTKV